MHWSETLGRFPSPRCVKHSWSSHLYSLKINASRARLIKLQGSELVRVWYRSEKQIPDIKKSVVLQSKATTTCVDESKTCRAASIRTVGGPKDIHIRQRFSANWVQWDAEEDMSIKKIDAHCLCDQLISMRPWLLIITWPSLKYVCFCTLIAELFA